MEQKVRRGDDNEMSNIGVSTLPKLRATPTEIWYFIYRFIKMCAGMGFFFFLFLFDTCNVVENIAKDCENCERVTMVIRPWCYRYY